MTDQQLLDSMLKPTDNIEKTLESLAREKGKPLTIGVMPQGPLTIPYVES